MNKTSTWFFAACALFLAFDAMAAPPAKVQISATKKRGEVVRAKPGGAGSEAKSTEMVSYVIAVKNVSSADLANLTVDYILFVERPKLGQKKTEPSFVERVKGSKPVETLTRKAPQTVATDEIALTTESVVGSYIFSDGGRIKAEESVMGVWVRVSQDGQMVGEYVAPASIAKQGWDKK